jgi:hypothetical protein
VVQDIFEATHKSKSPLSTLDLPVICTVEVGIITQVFVKPKVCVIELHRPLAYGDLIMYVSCFRCVWL